MRRAGRRGFAAGWMLAMVSLTATEALTQEQVPISVPILTLDQERLFAGSRAAERISASIEVQVRALAAENRQIEADLGAEELELTERRAGMPADEFRKLADAFDEKVQGIRAEQDAKAQELQQSREEERQAFLRRITPVLAEIVRERGALVVLDRRGVLLSADSIDITEEAIARIDQTFGGQDGNASEPETPAQE